MCLTAEKGGLSCPFPNIVDSTAVQGAQVERMTSALPFKNNSKTSMHRYNMKNKLAALLCKKASPESKWLISHNASLNHICWEKLNQHFYWASATLEIAMMWFFWADIQPDLVLVIASQWYLWLGELVLSHTLTGMSPDPCCPCWKCKVTRARFCFVSLK